MKRKKLNDVYEDWAIGDGIFSSLLSINGYTPPWGDSTNVANILDMQYHGNVSGYKNVSPLVNKIAYNYTNWERKIAEVIKVLHGDRWQKLWNTLNFEYNPIENYSMLERMTNDRTVTEYGRTNTKTDNYSHTKRGSETLDVNENHVKNSEQTYTKTGTENVDREYTEIRTDDLTHGKCGSETRTEDFTNTNTPNLNKDVQENVYAFNSADEVPSNTKSEHESGTNETTNVGTEEKSYNITESENGTVDKTGNGTDVTTHNISENSTDTENNTNESTNETVYDVSENDNGTQITEDGGEDVHTRNYTLTRTGNIGTVTAQDMIMQEREIQIWNFFDVVFADIDKILTLSVY